MIKVEQRVKPLVHRFMERRMGELRDAQSVTAHEAEHLTVKGVTIHTDVADFHISVVSQQIYPGEVLDLAYKLYVKKDG